MTNFTGNDLNSRPFARGAAPSQPPAGGRARPQGVVGTGNSGGRTWVREGVGPTTPDHPLQPLQGFRGPLRCPVLLGTSARWLGSTPVYPPWYPPSHTPPNTHPGTPHVMAARVHREYGTPGTCTYDRFWDVVGEPRGVEHSPLFRVPAGLYSILRFTRPFD